MNQSQVKLMSWQYGGWTYGLGKGWLVGMKPAARAAQAAARHSRTDGEGWMVGAEVDCSGPQTRIPRRWAGGGLGGRTGMSL